MDLLESWFHVSPDGGDGSLELVYLALAGGRTWVAYDAGIFVSDDEGGSWRDLTHNLPNVSFVDLVHHEKAGTLTAATYGRSLWRLRI